MKKVLFTITLLFLCVFSTFSQNKQDKFWDLLLSNKRAEAAKQLKKINVKSSIETLALNELLRVEQGKLTANKAFLSAFLEQPEFENYLYAFWNEPFVFDAYLETGFSPKNISNIEQVYASNLKNRSIKDAMHYLNAVVKRHQGDWDAYFELNNKINAITNWQYCGVFENLNDSGLDKIYDPEKIAQSETPFDAGSNGLVNWYTANTEKEPYQFFTNHAEFGAGVHYAQTFIHAAQEKRVLLRIGNGSAFKVWLNDVLVYENAEDQTTELDAYQVNITVPAGENRLLIKNAENSAVSYFMVSVMENDKAVEGFTYSSEYKAYNKSTLAQINPEVLTNSFEDFFIKKKEENPNNFFYDYCLISTYLRNEKYKEAKEVLMPWSEKYPKSSLIRKILIEIYGVEEDYTSINEITENMERDDEDYYLPLVLKIIDTDALSRMTMSEFETFLNKFKNSVDLNLFNLTADFYLNARKENKKGLKKNLDDLIDEAKGNTRLLLRYAPLYAALYDDDDTTIKILEDINKNYFITQASKSLSYYYDKKGRKEDAINVLYQDYDNLKNDNYYLQTIIEKLQSYDKYKESIAYIAEGLNNFPHSFTMLEYKGDALLQLNKKKEAIAAYEASLKYNSAHTSLRKKISDLKEEKNRIDDLIPEEVYQFIADNKGVIPSNNYGYNVLLDDGNIELYEEGGGKYRFVLVYEITSDSGVERFKEYNLGLSGDYNISKSEIVKDNGSVVPADRSGSSLVFNGLTVGDVIHLDYQNTFSNVGRFYKDYVDYFQMDSFHPIKQSSVQILVPKSLNFNQQIINGTLDFSTKEVEDYTLYTWNLNDSAGLSQDENYMPATVDVARGIHISTIGSWNDIAVWYSDLVRSRIEINATVQKVFDTLFPNGYKTLSETERAETIYKYITGNFTYSYVSFRQSGYVPQKPSKTINTALGDCKDFSTLFVTLARMADLDANLVLILTSDYGEQSLVLPSQDFNHCIAKVKLDGKDQFLELTDKYMPFKALPRSLYLATGLEIPYETTNTTKKYELFQLKDVQRTPAVFSNKVDVKVTPENLKLVVDTEFTGHVASYYESLFAEPNQEVLKNSIYDDYNARIEEDFVLNNLTSVKRVADAKAVNYIADITITNKIKKIGSIQIIQLPIVANPYTSGIISRETRNYPINYADYENVDEYKTAYTITIDEEKSFIEIPQNHKLSFKEHVYEITYTLEKNNVLHVNIHAIPSLKSIHPEDYEAFKTFVKTILDAENELIGFK